MAFCCYDDDGMGAHSLKKPQHDPEIIIFKKYYLRNVISLKTGTAKASTERDQTTGLQKLVVDGNNTVGRRANSVW